MPLLPLHMLLNTNSHALTQHEQSTIKLLCKQCHTYHVMLTLVVLMLLFKPLRRREGASKQLAGHNSYIEHHQDHSHCSRAATRLPLRSAQQQQYDNLLVERIAVEQPKRCMTKRQLFESVIRKCHNARFVLVSASTAASAGRHRTCRPALIACSRRPNGSLGRGPVKLGRMQTKSALFAAIALLQTANLHSSLPAAPASQSTRSTDRAQAHAERQDRQQGPQCGACARSRSSTANTQLHTEVAESPKAFFNDCKH